MSELAHTPLAAQELARAKLKAREDGIRAQATRHGREQERKEILEEFGAASLDDMRVINRVLADNDQRWQREERKAKAGALWRGISIGACVGAAFASVGYLVIVGEAMQQAFDRAQQVMAQTLAMRMVQQQAQDGGVAQDAGVDRNPVNGRPLREPASAP